MRQRLHSWLLRQVPARQAYPDLQMLAHLPHEAFPFAESPAITFADEASYLIDEGGTTPDMFAALLPGALYDGSTNVVLAKRGRIVSETDNIWREFPGLSAHHRYYWRFQYTKPRRRLEGVCMVLRSPANNYYHTLVDNLPRLFWLHQPAFRGMKIQVMVPGPLLPWEQFYLPYLLPENAQLKEVDPRYLWSGDQMLFGSYLSRQMSGALPRCYLDYFLPRVLPDRPRRRRHRLYITRKQAPGGRHILNEAELMRVLEPHGFVPCVLETLRIDEQIELFYDAEMVVAPHGAGLTNILYSQTIDLVELHPTPAIMPHYYFMARAMGHRYHALCANETGRHSSFAVDVAILSETLEKITSNIWRERV
jgi:capsular polysaccharide biosynthesis protein